MHEFAVRNRVPGVYIKVLRVAERREHSAEVGGNVLHDEGERHVLFFARRGQNEVTERQEGEKRHVVGDQHGAEEGDVHERNPRGTRRAG